MVLQKKNISVELFIKALRDENNGHFEEAAVMYQSALKEVNKIRSNSKLKQKIIEKLKVLHMIIAYHNSTHFVRQQR